MIFSVILCNIHRQPEEEVGSAGEQPASNKVDAYTIKEAVIIWLLSSFIGKLYGYTKLICR